MNFNGVFNGFWILFGFQVGAKIDPKSQKVCLQSAFEKTIEKYNLWGRKSLLPKSKNIAKPLEGCSKSHFSHTRNEVEKVTPRHLILGRFLEPKSTQDRKTKALEIVTKINSIFNQIFYWFWFHFGPHGPPQSSTFFIIFCSWGHSWAILAPRGHPKCSKTAPELDFPRNLDHFGINFQKVS